MTKITNESIIKQKVERFAYKTLDGLNDLSIKCFKDESLFLFYKKILDLYVNNISVLYDLNGFTECPLGKTPFLGLSDLQDPCEFIRQLDSFIGNCLLDDASYYCVWRKTDKKPKEFAGATFLIPYIDTKGERRNVFGNLAQIPCDEFDPDSNPIIIADYSGDQGGQDVDYLNRVVDFAINKNKEQNKRIKEWERRRDAK